MAQKATLLIIAAISIFLLAMVAIFTIDIKDTTAIKEFQSQQTPVELR